MKIFFSHSSRQKPLVREVKHYLPDHIKVWIDEDKLLLGDSIATSLKDAIETTTDFLILFVDNYAVRSEWVKRELQWALEHEGRSRRTFVLPVVLDEESWESLEPAELKARKYIRCYDFSEIGVRTLANELIAHLFAWLSRDLVQLQQPPALPDSYVKLLTEADRYERAVANHIRKVARGYSREQPLPLDDLFRRLRSFPETTNLADTQFSELLVRLQQRGLLAGVVCQGNDIHVEEDHYAWKTTLFTDEKIRIARKAVQFIRSGNVIVLDAGSTTLEIAREIARRLRLHAWENLKVVTNSISSANELLVSASEMGLEDDNRILQVYIVGGRIRANTLAIVEDGSRSLSQETSLFSAVGRTVGDVDLAFVGTNGVFDGIGFTTHSEAEVRTKQEMLRLAQRKFIVSDSSKLGIRQGHPFAPLDGIELILGLVEDEAAVVARCGWLTTAPIKIIYA